MIRRRVTGVPAFLIGDDMIVGFDQNRILSLVDHRLVECNSCKKRMRVPTDQGRVKVTCPYCGNEFYHE